MESLWAEGTCPPDQKADCWFHWSMTLTSKSWRFKTPAIWSASVSLTSVGALAPGYYPSFHFSRAALHSQQHRPDQFYLKTSNLEFCIHQHHAVTLLFLQKVGVPVIIVFNHWKLLTVFNNTFQKFYSNPLSVRFSVRLLFLREICLKVTPQNVNNLKVFILISFEFMLNVPRVKKEIC